MSATQPDQTPFPFSIGDQVRAKNNPGWTGQVNTYDETQNDLHITDHTGDQFWSRADGWERIDGASS